MFVIRAGATAFVKSEKIFTLGQDNFSCEFSEWPEYAHGCLLILISI